MTLEEIIEKYELLLQDMREMHKHCRNYGFESLVKEFVDDLRKIKTAKNDKSN